MLFKKKNFDNKNAVPTTAAGMNTPGAQVLEMERGRLDSLNADKFYIDARNLYNICHERLKIAYKCGSVDDALRKMNAKTHNKMRKAKKYRNALNIRVQQSVDDAYLNMNFVEMNHTVESAYEHAYRRYRYYHELQSDQQK